MYFHLRQRTSLPQKSEHDQEEASPLGMLGAEACCCNDSSFRSHNHWSLRFLKLFLLHKDGGGWKTCSEHLYWLIICSTLLHTLKNSSATSSTLISFTIEMILFHKLKRSIYPKPSFRVTRIPLALAHNFQLFNNELF